MTVGYGRDTWCDTNGIQPGRIASGPMALVLAMIRRVTSTRGTLRGLSDDAPQRAYGLDLPGYVGAVGYPTAVQAIPALLRGEWLKDDRIADVDVKTTVSTDPAGLMSITLDVHVTPADEALDFVFTLSVDDVSVALVGGVS